MATAGSMSGLCIHLGLTQVKSRAKQTRGRIPKLGSCVIRIYGVCDDGGPSASPISTSGERQRLRGMNGQDGARFLEAIRRGYKQLSHRIEAVDIEQRAYALPQQALAAHLCPEGLEQSTAPLLSLVD